MAADPSIWNTIPQPRSFIDYARDFGQLRDDVQKREANALLIQNRRQDAEQANALLNFERTLGDTPEDQLPDAYQRVGYINRAEELRSKQAERRRAAAVMAREDQQAKAGKRAFLLQGLAGINDRETAKQHLADGVQAGVYSMNEATRMMQSVPTDPVAFARWRDTLVLGGDKVADNERQTARNAAQERHEREMERLRAIEVNRPRNPSGGDIRTQVIEGPDGFRVVTLEGPNVGQSVPVTQAGGSQVLGKRGQTIAQKAQDAKLLGDLATEAEPLIANATGSYLGVARDALGRTIGSSTSGSEAIAKLRVIQGKMLSLVDRMEGPQSDADRIVYMQAVGNLSDNTQTAGDKQAALQTIKQLQERYFGRGAPTMPGPKPTTAEQVPNTRATPLIAPGMDLGNGFSVVK